MIAIIMDFRDGDGMRKRKRPEDGPPFADRDLFSGLFEGVRTFAVGASNDSPMVGIASKSTSVTGTLPTRRQSSSGRVRVLVLWHEGSLFIDDFESLGD
jgi:hypothetical protein